jgi:hypothetical protein
MCTRSAAIPRYEWQGVVVGIAERDLYIPALAMGRPEFLLLWLTLKTVARARRWTDDELVPGRAVFNNFLIGNSLSIALSLVGAGMVNRLSGPSWIRGPRLAWQVPAGFTAFVLGLWLYLKV